MITFDEMDWLQRTMSKDPRLDIKNDYFNIRNSNYDGVYAGVDVAYFNSNGDNMGSCSIVIIERYGINTKILTKRSYTGKVEVSYKSGYLSFRELPLVLKAIELIEKDIWEKVDVVLFDGNGYLHKRHMGIATHASLVINKPTIGVAKTFYKLDDNFEYDDPGINKGSYTDIVLDNTIYGRAVRTLRGCTPIFVSCGNLITIDSATKIVLSLVNGETHRKNESRIPLPVRLADMETHIIRELNLHK